MIWVVGVCGMSPLVYFFAFAYPGLSFTLLRSFNEHRLGETDAERTGIVESNFFWVILTD